VQLTDHQRQFARSLRRRQTDAESLIWYHLRGRRFMDLRFRRQHPIGPYFADFACLDLQLVIELDGGQHNDPDGLERDARRTSFLRSRGFVVLRFWDNDVLRTPLAVLGSIAQTVQAKKRSGTPRPASPSSAVSQER
jgi:very-short-patch-repair endonuclease